MKLKITIIALTVLTASACKSFLEVTPQGKVIPKTEEDFEALLNSILFDIEMGLDETVLGYYDQVIRYEAISDNLDANITAGKLDVYAGDVANLFQGGRYEGLYSTIKDCNLIIDHMKELSSDKSKKLCAAAYAIKGICFYNLVRIYCEPYEESSASTLPGVAVVPKFDVESNDIPDRGTIKKSFDYAVSLLTTSIDYHMTDKVYIFNEPVVKAFLAKLYFWGGKWDKVIPLCEELLAVPAYGLAERSAYTNAIQADNAQLQEVIIRDRTRLDNEIKQMYDETFKTYLVSRPVNATLIKLFGSDPAKDIRWSIMCNNKRVNQKAVVARVRGSELHLMLAECYAHSGPSQNLEKSLSLLNDLRRKRIEGVEDYTLQTLPQPDPTALIQVDATGTALTALMSAIFDERRKEFYMEGDRWFELKRNGRPEWWIIQQIGSTPAIKYVTKKYLYTMPVSVRDIQNSKGKIQQNPGYTH